MGMFDEMLARLGESNVSDAEIRQIMEKAAKEAGVLRTTQKRRRCWQRLWRRRRLRWETKIFSQMKMRNR